MADTILGLALVAFLLGVVFLAFFLSSNRLPNRRRRAAGSGAGDAGGGYPGAYVMGGQSDGQSNDCGPGDSGGSCDAGGGGDGGGGGGGE